jgi:ergothioneine biosynthesis protein EgtB
VADATLRADGARADPVLAAARQARQGDAAALAAALLASRADTLATFDAFAAARPDLTVPCRPELNPPLWELGHVGWFQAHWIGRNPLRLQGPRADPQQLPAHGSDALYDSARVPHGARWTLPLPAAPALREELAGQLAQTLALLHEAPPTDDGLYFFRLVLAHEDMHHEAALYMARGLDLPLPGPRWQPPRLPPPPAPLELPAAAWHLGGAGPLVADAATAGAPTRPGFAFDNELPGQPVALPATAIDAQVLRWAEFLPFAEAGGYADPRWWTPEGWAWRTQAGAGAPLHLQRDGARWRERRAGAWHALDPAQPACHLSLHEALAWCRWAGRRLPTEAEWERAACTAPGAFRWGDVWEWTASAFAPFPGFEPHPYREYSQPFFDGRPVLRGGSFMTQPRMKHPRYRNYFAAHRRDVPAGFRTCAA